MTDIVCVVNPTGHRKRDHKPPGTPGRRTTVSQSAKNSPRRPSLYHYLRDNSVMDRGPEAMTNVFDVEDSKEHRNVRLAEIARRMP